MKKNKFEFIIDSEFQSQIPALTDEEFQQLEENILSEGEVLSPLIVWGNILVDGHNRYKILQQHPEIPYTTRSISCTCETREDVLAWICKHQLGRRNLTPEQKKFLIGKQYHSEKSTRGGNHGNQYTQVANCQIDNSRRLSQKACGFFFAQKQKGGIREMAVFRVEKNSGYTVMSNHHLRNRALSLKAKGLLSKMLSLPEDWDYTLQGLARINRESIDAIRQAIRELEQAGYIQRSRERDEKGRLRGADYVIFELPQPVPVSVSPTLEKPTLENPMQLNKDKL